MSRPEVNKSSKQNFIKMILTKDQRRSKRNKKKVRIRKNRCIELVQTCYCTKKFNIALSLCEVLEDTFYFSKSFLKAVAEALWSLEVTIVCFLG